MLALGLREPVERTLQTKARLDFSNVLAVLEEDARALAGKFGPVTMAALGDAPAATPATEAMWASDERSKAWGKEQLQHARRLAEYGDPRQLAQEANDFRPEPA